MLSSLEPCDAALLDPLQAFLAGARPQLRHLEGRASGAELS